MRNLPYIKIYHRKRGMYEVEINYDCGSTMAASAIKSNIEDCKRYIEKRLENLDLDDVHSTFELIVLGRKIPKVGNRRIEETVRKYNEKIINYHPS